MIDEVAGGEALEDLDAIADAAAGADALLVRLAVLARRSTFSTPAKTTSADCGTTSAWLLGR